MFESIKKSAQSFKKGFFQAVQERVAKEVEKAMNQPESWEKWIAHHVKHKAEYVRLKDSMGLNGEVEWQRVYEDMNKVRTDLLAGSEAKVTAVRDAVIENGIRGRRMPGGMGAVSTEKHISTIDDSCQCSDCEKIRMWTRWNKANPPS